jgi:glyoxylase-like metal-dependent hydrolase (beta-lactamase superfamily II)
MRAVSLHSDVIVVTSALLAVNCVIVRGPRATDTAAAAANGPAGADVESADVEQGAAAVGETFAIDSPVLPDELDALPALVEQAGFAAPSGLLATHGDWDHLLGRLAFPGVVLGVAQTTAQRLHDAPGEAQRELRGFDEELLIERDRPLALGALQSLPVPGRCDIGAGELALHVADGHTADGMAIVIPWARVLVAGDYLSTAELPTLNEGGDLDAYLDTLGRVRGLLAGADHVVPGHGPILGREAAADVLEQDAAYLRALREHGRRAELPQGRRSAGDRRTHAENAAAVR